MSTVQSAAQPQTPTALTTPSRPSAGESVKQPADLFALLLTDWQTLDGSEAAASEGSNGQPSRGSSRDQDPLSGDASWNALLAWALQPPGSAQPASTETQGEGTGLSIGSQGLVGTPAAPLEAEQRIHPALQGQDASSADPLRVGPGRISKARDKNARPNAPGRGDTQPLADIESTAQRELTNGLHHNSERSPLGLAAASRSDPTSSHPTLTLRSSDTTTFARLETSYSGTAPQHDAGAGHASGAARPAAPGSASLTAPTFGEHLQLAVRQTLETLSAQVTMWQAGQSHHASLTFDAAGDDPLAVEVKVEQGVAHLAFRTDDAAARQLIQAQAPQALAEALARAGLALGQLDVGARGQSDGGSEGSARSGRRWSVQVPTEPAAAATRVASGVLARGAVDVYA
ncbi:Flagellar hook-length control protein FliK [Tepidimonas alkaliphilus]|uniref:Flagellar hook-length control protein FliK n=1 Tax=Tepidimonas alkaliphilus TaxID=2588942 RepID=A0A554W4V6_9BURK|nr:flagellar hook-length control protein FliK [Tepidimonas alkaliphilus]TSE18594.1 Flagellar hook-length control protein FliK [Tepidimonas alkaliphilus]